MQGLGDMMQNRALLLFTLLGLYSLRVSGESVQKVDLLDPLHPKLVELQKNVFHVC